MAFVVSAVVGFVGAAVGTAVGAAVFGTAVMGTIAGVSITAGLIGGVIGAGLAGGILSAARGGSFGKGFLMGAAGGAIGGFLKGAFDGVTGVGAAAEGASASGEGFSAIADSYNAANGVTGSGAALEGAATGAADAAGGASTYGMGDISAPTGTPLDASGAAIAPVGDLASSATEGATTSIPSLDTQFGDYSGQAGAFNQPGGLQNLGGAGSTVPDVSSYGGGLEQTVAGAGNTPTSSYEMAPQTGTPSTLDNTGSVAPDANAQPAPQGGGLSDMWNSAKTMWNDNMPAGSAQKLLLGGADYLQKNYEAHKLEKINKGMKPLTFEEWKAQYAPDDAARYAAASNQMARSGHTGTLPILMAQMNQRANAGYQAYRPGAQQTQLNNAAALSNLRQGTRSAAIRPLSELNWGN